MTSTAMPSTEKTSTAADAWIEANDPDLTQTAAYIAEQINAPADGVLANIVGADQTVSLSQADVDQLKAFAEFRTTLSPDVPTAARSTSS